MSFEGYMQYVCANGHLVECDVYMETVRHSPGEGVFHKTCLDCGAPIAWSNCVDETNMGDDDWEDTRILLETDEDSPRNMPFQAFKVPTCACGTPAVYGMLCGPCEAEEDEKE